MIYTGPSGANDYDDVLDQLKYATLPEYREWNMIFWDNARSAHTKGFTGTWYRETYESIIEGYQEDLRNAIKEIERLRNECR